MATFFTQLDPINTITIILSVRSCSRKHSKEVRLLVVLRENTAIEIHSDRPLAVFTDNELHSNVLTKSDDGLK